MKKMFLVLMLVVLSSLAFAARGDKGQGGDFYSLYDSAYTAVETPEMHKEYGVKNGDAEKVKDIINKGWYDMKMLEADKLKHVFTIDKYMIDGAGNKEKVESEMDKIQEIGEKMTKVYEDTKKELSKVMHADKLN